jgi:subtilisin-like proprotein convertase family protein
MYKLLDQVSDRTFWLLWDAFDVNNNGEIVGHGAEGKRNDSQEHGFLARPEGTTGQQPPDAVDDPATTDMDTPVTIDVLANDSDPENDPLDVIAVTQGSDGSVVINPDDTVTYTPTTGGFIGTDTFSYTISDGNGGEDTATVTVTVRDPSAGQTFTSSDTPQNIADPHPRKGPRTTTSEISITSSDLIGTLVLDVDITHGAEAGLIVTLASPTNPGDPQLLSYESATDTWSIPDPNPFIGQHLGGTWTLSITDTVKDGKTGTLNAWSMTVTPQAGETAAASAPLAADLFFSDLGDSSEEESDPILQPDVSELLLYEL